MVTTIFVTVFDAGISDNRAYIAMELLKGRDLRQLRAEGWRPTPTSWTGPTSSLKLFKSSNPE